MGKSQSKSSITPRGRRGTVSGGTSPSSNAGSQSSVPSPARKNTVASSAPSSSERKKEPKGENKKSEKGKSEKGKSEKGKSDRVDGFSLKSLEDLFDSYAEQSKTHIGVDGIIRFCEDIGVEPEDSVMLFISWMLNAQEQGSFSRSEFVSGFEKRKVDSIKKIKCKLPEWRAEMKSDPNTFRDVYKFAFSFSTGGEKHLELEVVRELLPILTSGLYNHTPDFCEFLEQQTSYKALNVDQWMSYLEFCRTVGDGESDFTGYDVSDPWPVLLDEYVGWYRKKKTKDKDGIVSDDDE
mmetsp:Transcript_29755/g.41100  ORF Transcript_29755/g.41100 Transcript_29755/m.41100 type:complete len:294 (-) Transcript_29755:231-1112(-)|eukprot:CAMPEP_0201484242 /NCGR_PEP_ID=MMETSP0151_2-20130828/8447_1 /ASSEMBLY_ACC=CAM_ASM_000257 /TAXON_ID=200890 /ORGANISM="Paramoeba atlantica, Strain 621/1 / CCAP 1560/9" /LENGTH=293 /DNA_ID=CAMNT_0047867821 /DNA_START=138 /DNA_END=1019 /DNA_ORIENTATION=-